MPVGNKRADWVDACVVAMKKADPSVEDRKAYPICQMQYNKTQMGAKTESAEVEYQEKDYTAGGGNFVD